MPFPLQRRTGYETWASYNTLILMQLKFWFKTCFCFTRCRTRPNSAGKQQEMRVRAPVLGTAVTLTRFTNTDSRLANGWTALNKDSGSCILLVLVYASFHTRPSLSAGGKHWRHQHQWLPISTSPVNMQNMPMYYSGTSAPLYLLCLQLTLVKAA